MSGGSFQSGHNKDSEGNIQILPTEWRTQTPPCQTSSWREPQFLLTQKQPDPLPWPLMSTVFPNDLRGLEFPDSNNFHVNPDPLAAGPLRSLLGSRSSGPTLSGTSGHKTKPEPCGKITLQTVIKVRVRRVRGRWQWHCGKTSDQVADYQRRAGILVAGRGTQEGTVAGP